MLNNVTLGQYYPVDSPIHRLDPRVKLVLTIAFIVSVFLVKDASFPISSFIGYALLLGFIILAARLSRVPFKLLLKGLKPLRLIILITFILNLFFTGGSVVWVEFWIIRITREAFLQALCYSLRLVFLVSGTSLLTLTTSPIALADGIELLLTPLKKLRFPAHELAMMMTIALRFIPTLLEETDKIMKAQMARGADFESGNLISRARSMVPLLVPLFVSAFRRAGDLAMAMESRCYHGGEGRTRLRVLKITRGDLLACGVVAVLIALIVVEGRFLPY
ncbi:MAG: energy-coupling factor transporter transmembrane protein EcfT [Clostridiales bacterium]|nr:energy-coupling factor transporter transmembrane protein EcfT [Clostridiales bacterium]